MRHNSLTVADMTRFEDDDDAFRTWIYAHPSGFVVNAVRSNDPGQPILHRAMCETITPTPDKAWTGQFIKLCSENRYELDAWARSVGKRLTECTFCEP
jgi:hypothetical protein